VAGQLGYAEYGFEAFTLDTKLFQVGAEFTLFREEMRIFREEAHRIRKLIKETKSYV
jgi:hypothetical protein